MIMDTSAQLMPFEEIGKATFPPVFCSGIYAVEWGGSGLKIGCSANMVQRVRSLESQARNYAGVKLGMVYFSPPHTNYRFNESYLHWIFSEERLRGELFDVAMDAFMEEAFFLKHYDERRILGANKVLFALKMKGFILGGLPLGAARMATREETDAKNFIQYKRGVADGSLLEHICRPYANLDNSDL